LQSPEATLGVVVREGAEDEHIDPLSRRSGHQTRRIQVRTEDFKIRIAAENAHEQLCMKPRIVGN
jgi:hypothetical protein